MTDVAPQWSTPDGGVDPADYVDSASDVEGGGRDTGTDAEQAGDVGGSGDVERPASEPADDGPGEDIARDEEPAEPNEPA
jgi:hypothetical protein